MNPKESPPLLIVYQMMDRLKPLTNNVRTHSSRQINQLAGSIRVFGFTKPILVDRDIRMVARHCAKAAKKTRHG